MINSTEMYTVAQKKEYLIPKRRPLRSEWNIWDLPGLSYLCSLQKGVTKILELLDNEYNDNIYSILTTC